MSTSHLKGFLRIKVCGLAFVWPALLFGANQYQATRATEQGMEVVHLSDTTTGTEISILPGFGNRAYEMKVHGKNILYFPITDLSALRGGAGRGLNGIPFLAPWANRMASGGFWANDQWYAFNSKLPTVRVNQNGVAMHGMLSASPLWEVVEVKADANSARLTSRFQFWKYPELMANWPFAHEYEMTYRLTHGELEVSTRIMNRSTQPMPVAIGFHPYFNLPGVPRAESTVSIPARKHVQTDSQLVATGELTANDLSSQVSLKDHTFDDGFTDLVREANGQAIFSVQGGGKKIEVIYGPKYQVAVIYAPPKQEYVCFEPMASITNGVNLAHEGKYAQLQSVPPGGEWRESFWVRPSGL